MQFKRLGLKIMINKYKENIIKLKPKGTFNQLVSELLVLACSAAPPTTSFRLHQVICSLLNRIFCCLQRASTLLWRVTTDFCLHVALWIVVLAESAVPNPRQCSNRLINLALLFMLFILNRSINIHKHCRQVLCSQDLDTHPTCFCGTTVTSEVLALHTKRHLSQKKVLTCL